MVGAANPVGESPPTIPSLGKDCGSVDEPTPGDHLTDAKTDDWKTPQKWVLRIWGGHPFLWNGGHFCILLHLGFCVDFPGSL